MVRNKARYQVFVSPLLLFVDFLVLVLFFIFIQRLFCVLIVERQSLSFIETSALDSTNVETAFVNILTGSFLLAVSEACGHI